MIENTQTMNDWFARVSNVELFQRVPRHVSCVNANKRDLRFAKKLIQDLQDDEPSSATEESPEPSNFQ